MRLRLQNCPSRVPDSIGRTHYGCGSNDRRRRERGAVILRVDDQQPESLVALARNIHNRKPGAEVKLGVVWEIRRGAFLQRRSGVATLKVR